MSKITREELMSFAIKKINTPYAYGAKGELLTQSLLKRLIKENPKVYTESYIKRTEKNLNKICVDCSGLISWCTGIIKGSRAYYDTALERQPIRLLDETMRGWALWKSGHIGVYLGDGCCIEASGVDRGVIQSQVKQGTWTHAIKLCDIDYSIPSAPYLTPALKDGWVKENVGWRYYTDYCTYIKNTWLSEENYRYWFDADGFAISEKWHQSNGKWYFFGTDCRMIIGLKEIEGHFYYFEQDGSMMPPKSTLILTADENGDLIPASYSLLRALTHMAGGR